MQSSPPHHEEGADDTLPKRAYTTPQLDELGDIRSATLGTPSPPLESGGGGAPEHP